MNIARFDKALDAIGYNYEDMQKLLGISRTAFYRKRKGITQFTLKEIHEMMAVLPDGTCEGIFFEKEVS